MNRTKDEGDLEEKSSSEDFTKKEIYAETRLSGPQSRKLKKMIKVGNNEKRKMKKVRNCLKCGEMFLTVGLTNRLCPSCKPSEE